jgi:hypothetical protein
MAMVFRAFNRRNHRLRLAAEGCPDMTTNPSLAAAYMTGTPHRRPERRPEHSRSSTEPDSSRCAGDRNSTRRPG